MKRDALGYTAAAPSGPRATGDRAPKPLIFRHAGCKRATLLTSKTHERDNAVDDSKRHSFLGMEAADVDSRPVCRDCWARYLCGGGCYADYVVYGPDKRTPQEQHCPFWRAEIEARIRFYDELRREDPALCLQLFGDSAADLISETDGGEALRLFQRRNCQ